MKSGKAKKIIRETDLYISVQGVMFQDSRAMMKKDAIKAVEIAEQEAEERMREKAKRAFECVWNATPKQVAEECGISIQEINNEAAAMKYCHQLFIQKLTQNGND